MKYIKKFEIVNSDGEIVEPDYKVGDYVEIYATESRRDLVADGVVLIENITKYWYICRYVIEGYVEWVYEKEIVRKLEEHEIEAMKYNI